MKTLRNTAWICLLVLMLAVVGIVVFAVATMDKAKAPASAPVSPHPCGRYGYSQPNNNCEQPIYVNPSPAKE